MVSPLTIAFPASPENKISLSADNASEDGAVERFTNFLLIAA